MHTICLPPVLLSSTGEGRRATEGGEGSRNFHNPGGCGTEIFRNAMEVGAKNALDFSVMVEWMVGSPGTHPCHARMSGTGCSSFFPIYFPKFHLVSTFFPIARHFSNLVSFIFPISPISPHFSYFPIFPREPCREPYCISGPCFIEFLGHAHIHTHTHTQTHTHTHTHKHTHTD